jgi:hypothetical protein
MAEKGKEGSVFFLEMKNANPICFMYLCSGKVSTDDPEKKEIHMHVEQEPRTYPYFPTSKESIQKLAYEEYTRRSQKKVSTANCTEVMMTKLQFFRKFTEITVAADTSAYRLHLIFWT